MARNRNPKKSKKPSKLKQFVKQYGHIYIGDYLYIECPRPMFKMLEASGWTPATEDMAAVQGKISKMARFTHYTHFYSKKEKVYYVIDHLWMATLTSWGDSEMQTYMRDVLARMVSKVWEKPKLVKAKSKSEHALVVDVVDEEGNSLKSGPIKTSGGDDKQLSLYEKVLDEVKDETFLEEYGITKEVYENMKQDSYVIEPTNGVVTILDLCKFLYKVEKVAMKDIYASLKKCDIISQPPKDMGGQFNIYLCKEWKEKKYGFNTKMKKATYPVFYKSGVVMLGMFLHDKGLVSKYILPA